MLIDFRTRPPYKSFLPSFYGKSAPVPNTPENYSIFAVGKDPIPSVEHCSIDLFMQEMNESETDLAVLMGRKADDNGHIDNDDIHELQQAHSDRFISFGGVNPLLPGQVEEVERVAKLGFRGIAVDAGWLRKELYIDDPILDPIYAKCQERGLILSLTSSFMLGSDLTFSIPDAIGHVARKFPKLKIVVPHACWPHVHLALAMAIRCTNVYLMPDCYVYIHGFPMSEDYIHAANGYLKYRMLYASTFPVRSLAQCKRDWMARDFTAEALELTMYKNAQRLLGL